MLSTETPILPQEQQKLTEVEQAALMTMMQHLEPCDCQWNTYADAARAVVRAVESAQARG